MQAIEKNKKPCKPKEQKESYKEYKDLKQRINWSESPLKKALMFSTPN